MTKLMDIFKFEYKNNTGLVNMTGEFFALYIKWLKDNNKKVFIVTPSMFDANKLFNIFSNYDDSYCFLSDDLLINNIVDSTPENKIERLNILNDLLIDKYKVLFTDLNGYLKKIPNINNYKDGILKYSVNDIIDVSLFSSKLFDMGYEKVSVVSKMGEVAIRGFVIDIFPINTSNPVRIELFGDTIESIRYFDIDKQTSIESVSSIDIFTFSEKFDTNYNTITDYFKPDVVIYKDYNQLLVGFNQLYEEFISYYGDDIQPFVNFDDIDVKNKLYYFDLDNEVINIKLDEIIDFNSKSIDNFNENIEEIRNYINNCISRNMTVIISLPSFNKKFLDSLDVNYINTDENNIFDNKINVIKKSFSYSFIYKNYIILTEHELFNRKLINKKKYSNYKYSSKIKDITKLSIGDFVVHNSYGIGIYNGIKILNKKGYMVDYIEVLYDKGDKLYIPASKIEYINKYSGKDGYVPKINALNSSSWYKTKQRVKEKIKYEAARLLRVQAERSMKKGFAFNKNDELQELFDNEFIFDETPDQIRVWNQIKSDMESDSPMDRILCGDVGYGKTEIAFRAMFKAVLDHKQVMYLCPTTLLSKQQYFSAVERFKSFPVNIALLNRFTSLKDTRKIVDDFANGKIDILFGTHRLLSKDIIPIDLGLLIIDEEQRFGVAHKEKIKEFKSNIDVLTLTATPIPRTLQMSMIGLKNLSLIETPPKNRHAVQTYITAFDRRLIKNIIYKEISRDGQVFILFNRVAEIEGFASEIARLIPDAKVIFAHGQMNKEELEDRMDKFVNGEFNVLVCTTIIETGVDIPNANSLIIIDADRFGLSQLYQIRGRVGRSDKIAYAYLMYNPNKMLNDIAIKRLKVIKEFTELGSGYFIASRDLSIRGAGDILGSEQAGFIDTVGIDLYMKLLNDELLKLKGIEVDDDEVDNSTPIIEVSNHIKDELVSDNDLKINIHKLINSIDSSKKLIDVKTELLDRFGNIDNDLELYMNEELFEKLIKLKGISQVIDNNMYVEIIIPKYISDNLSYEDLFSKSIEISRDFIFGYRNGCICIKILKNKVKKHPIFYFNELLEKM